MKATMTQTSEKQWTSNDFLQFPWAVFQLLLNAFSPDNDILLLLMAKVRKTSTQVLSYLGYDSIVIFYKDFIVMFSQFTAPLLLCFCTGVSN